MAYRYDEEKERLVRMVKKQEPYDGPTQCNRLKEITFDETTRKMVISYIVVKKKKTIKKSFTYCGNKYKLYSDWQTTETPKTKKLTLTNAKLEELNNDSDEIVCTFIENIIAAIPSKLEPSWHKKQTIRKKVDALKQVEYNALGEKYAEEYTAKYHAKVESEKTAEAVAKKLTQQKKDKTQLSQELEIANAQMQKLTRFSILKYILFFKYLPCKSQIASLTEALHNTEERIKQLEDKYGVVKEELRKNTTEYSAFERKVKAEKDAITTKFDDLYKQEIAGVESLKAEVKKVSAQTKNGCAPASFVSEERAKMGRIYADGLTLRDYILKRDNYTCQCCGNSREKEPNLLLEVDHIHPVSKWGPSVPENLETLCWKCNRTKGNNA